MIYMFHTFYPLLELKSGRSTIMLLPQGSASGNYHPGNDLLRLLSVQLHAVAAPVQRDRLGNLQLHVAYYLVVS